MKLPKSVTVLGVVLALAAVVVDPVNAPWLTDLLGAQASAKLAAVGGDFMVDGLPQVESLAALAALKTVRLNLVITDLRELKDLQVRAPSCWAAARRRHVCPRTQRPAGHQAVDRPSIACRRSRAAAAPGRSMHAPTRRRRGRASCSTLARTAAAAALCSGTVLGLLLTVRRSAAGSPSWRPPSWPR
jgi:hypothetical protein